MGKPQATTPFATLDLAPKGCVLPSLTLPALNAVVFFSVSLLLLISVKFRVNPWLILILLLPSVKFRVNPWLVFCLFLIPWLIHCFLVHPFV